MSDNDSAGRVTRRGRRAFGIDLPGASPPVVFEGEPRPDARVQFYGVLHGSDSYANVSGIVARVLVDRLPGVSICNYVGGEVEDPRLAPHAGLNWRAPVGIFAGFPTHVPARFHEHRIRVGLFVCETDRILPEWVRACNRFHLVGVPSRHCRAAFLRSGVTVPVMVVPHGVLPAHAPIPERSPPGNRFVFYNTFRRQVARRKGYEELMRCFQAAFEGRDDVVLRLRVGDHRWLRTCPGWPDYGGLIEFDPPSTRQISEAAAIYSEVHCTVHPSKAEGFGLVPLESIACETPVIAPPHTGMADYLDESNAMLLRPGREIRAPRVDHQCGRFRAVDEEHLVELLRSVPDRWPQEKRRLVEAGPEVRAHYAWPRVLAPLMELVEQGLECGDSWEFGRLTSDLLEPGEVERCHEDAGRRARRPAPPESAGKDREALRFSSLIYCGWDYPHDGVGNHLRLLDRLVFNGPEIRHRSLDELPGAPYHPEPLPGIESYIHEQRPDLFQGALYLDIVGFHGDQTAIRAQIDRVEDARRRFGAKTAIYLMWESDRLWAPVLELIQAYDLTIVTSNLLAGYLDERGVPYEVLPHPYEYAVCRPGPGPDGTPEPLVVGLSAGLWPRKNVAPAVEAFAAVWGNDPRAALRVHSRSVPRDPAARREHERIEEVVREYDNIELEVRSFTPEEYLAWMSSLDVYCFVSSGEGWSVTPREALHLGKPVVLLDAHVHREFSHLPGVIRVAPGPPREARPGAAFVDGGIGVEAGLDPAALESVLSVIIDLYGPARRALASRFQEIIDFHDVGETRRRWIRALNERLG